MAYWSLPNARTFSPPRFVDFWMIPSMHPGSAPRPARGRGSTLAVKPWSGTLRTFIADSSWNGGRMQTKPTSPLHRFVRNVFILLGAVLTCSLWLLAWLESAVSDNDGVFKACA